MDDLLKRLRTVRNTSGIYAPGLLPSTELINPDGPEAAAEIERLRTALQGMYVLFGEPLEDEYTGVQAYKSALDVVEKARIALRK